jgi:hypothetical protein
VDLLSAGRYKSLRQAIGEPVDGGQPKVPHWDAASGELRYDGAVVREVGGRAKNIRLLLESFQEQGWPPRIDSPFPARSSFRKLRYTVDSLKDNLKAITFRCDGTSKGVMWSELSGHRSDTGA